MQFNNAVPWCSAANSECKYVLAGVMGTLKSTYSDIHDYSMY